MYNQSYGEQQQNLFAYHQVFADSLKVINENHAKGMDSDARKYIMSNLIYALTLNMKRELKKDELKIYEDMEYSELYSHMVREQDKAGLIPFQQFHGKSVFQQAQRNYERSQKAGQ